MTGNMEQHDGRRDGDALDRAIDDALGAVLGDGPRGLRAQVLARLEEPVEDRASRWWSTLLRPALLPAAGAVLILVGVTVSWWRVDDQLGRIGSGRYLADAGLASRSPASGTVARGGPAAAEVPIPAGAPATLASPAASREPQAVSRDNRVFAASLLEMDALGRPRGVAADAVVAPDEEPESFLPGAVGGDLGDPIKPIPRLRPIMIPPIVAAPIVDAPPVSTLATPVSTLSGDNNSRDRTDPGKPGGVCP